MSRFAASIRICLATVLLVFSASASANTLVWNLTGVTFDDGGTASGQFSYDSNAHKVGFWSISVAGGNTASFPEITYQASNSTKNSYNGGNPQDTIYFQLNDGSNRQFRITPSAALSNTGGTIPLYLAYSSGNVECFNCSPFRSITAGSLVASVAATPTSVPALSWPAMASLIAALAVLGLARRRRIRR